MKCLNCGQTMGKKKIDRYHYTECGLPKIYLKNMKALRCPSCDEEEVEVPNIEQLHAAIARDIALQKERLRPEEIRFLRAHLGFSGADFANAISVKPETVSRWENGRRLMDTTAEKFLRVLILSGAGPFREYEDLPAFASKQNKAQPTIRVFQDTRGWKTAAAA